MRYSGILNKNMAILTSAFRVQTMGEATLLRSAGFVLRMNDPHVARAGMFSAGWYTTEIEVDLSERVVR